ncbi:hypothetical protein ACNKHR_18600 [Shigella flexneri]
MGIKSSDAAPAPVAGMKTVSLTAACCTSPMMVNIWLGPMYDVSGTAGSMSPIRCC